MDPVLAKALVVCLVAFGLTLLWVFDRPHGWIVSQAMALRWRCCRRGCCSSCDGTGSSYDVETNGRCWDCYGTGHCHP